MREMVVGVEKRVFVFDAAASARSPSSLSSRLLLSLLSLSLLAISRAPVAASLSLFASGRHHLCFPILQCPRSREARERGSTTKREAKGQSKSSFFHASPFFWRASLERDSRERASFRSCSLSFSTFCGLVRPNLATSSDNGSNSIESNWRGKEKRRCGGDEASRKKESIASSMEKQAAQARSLRINFSSTFRARKLAEPRLASARLPLHDRGTGRSRSLELRKRKEQKGARRVPVGGHDDAGPVERVGAGVGLDAVERELRGHQEHEQAHARVEHLFAEGHAPLRRLDVGQQAQERPHELERSHRFFFFLLRALPIEVFFFFLKMTFVTLPPKKKNSRRHAANKSRGKGKKMSALCGG